MKCPQIDPKPIWKKIQKDKQIDLFTVFSTFDMDKLGRYGYAKSQNFTGVCVVGAQTCTPPYKRLQNLATLRCIFTSFQQITFKFGNFINFKALFSVMSTDFPELVHVKSWKNREKVYLFVFLYFFSYRFRVGLGTFHEVWPSNGCDTSGPPDLILNPTNDSTTTTLTLLYWTDIITPIWGI